MKKPIIGFVGLSHLGICSLISLASKNYKVIGFDFSLRKINKLNNNLLHIDEPYLEVMLNKFNKNIEFTDNFSSIKNCDIVYLSEDVITKKSGKSDLSVLKKYVKAILKNINKNSYLVIHSQVPPSFTRKINFEKNKLFYQVETLIIGNAVNRALKPERIILGTNNLKINKNSKFYLFLKHYNCPIVSMNYESAELAKISINMMLIANISTANKLSEICEKIGANWIDIVPSLKMDKRIGKNSYINTGLGLSGGNLERDLYNSIDLCDHYKLDKSLFNSYVKNSILNKNWPYTKFLENKKYINKKINIGIIGVTYKINTNSIKNSPSIYLIKKLTHKKIEYYDPNKEVYNNKFLVRTKNIKDIFINSDVIFVMLHYKELLNLNKIFFNSLIGKKIIIDPFAIFKNYNFNKKKIKYIYKGNSLR
ncbi:hypothetical protein OAJ95_03750 [Pelagibacteraceae bacterium]|nr:hypothetical protein [Pelagibacteraceae bacterium]